MEEKSEAHHFEDSGDEADDASDNSDLAREKQRARQANGWSKKSRDLYVGGLLKFGPTRLRHIELATPTPGHEGTCFGKPLDEQRAIASGFAALCLKSMGKTIADYPWAPRVVDPSATTDLTDGVLREQNFLGKVSCNAASYLEKMQMAYDLHELVRKHLGGDEAGGAVADEPPVFAREGMLAFRMARGASAEEAVAVEAAEDQAATAAEPTDDEAAIKAEDDAKVLYTQHVRRLAQLKVPVGAPARTAPCASWGSRPRIACCCLASGSTASTATSRCGATTSSAPWRGCTCSTRRTRPTAGWRVTCRRAPCRGRAATRLTGASTR
ncbi:hypothetical protein T492DRAFT_384269 [Pavlovales sp. CCMP2436]|nr:hypothetical protein T492DRAFT_384269 [Pavlovales sp. CCMP2436]